MLSKKTQYALKALSYMMENNNGAPILIATIAEEKKIPIKFLENIFEFEDLSYYYNEWETWRNSFRLAKPTD